MVGGEDCLNEVSSVAAPDAALRPKEISGSGGVIFFDYFLLHKQKKVIRCRATPDKIPKPLDSVSSAE